MKINAIITGSTGMIGKGVLLECLDDPGVEKVLLVNRRKIDINHPKIKEVILEDFLNPESIKSELAGYNAVYYCLGISAGGMKEEAYKQITYDYTLNFAKVVLEMNPELTFIYVSGQGTVSSEKGRMMWARVKGATENALLKLPFKQAYMFRPGIIRPLRGIKSRTNWYSALYTIINPFWPVLTAVFGKYITDTRKIGIAMINATLNGSSKVHHENPDINELARS